MAIAYFHNEILRRSGVAAFPAAYDDLEYSIKDNKSNIDNLPPYVPEPSSIDVDLLIDIKKVIKERISPEYDNDRVCYSILISCVLLTLLTQVRLAVHELYDGIFEGVTVECRETLANIQAHLELQKPPRCGEGAN
jgi:hypothetical protein